MQVQTFGESRYYEQESDHCIVLLPGFGYLFDRPLLRDAKMLALQRGFCVLELSFGELPYDKTRLTDSIDRCVPIAVKRAHSTLDKVNGQQLHFIAKSFGTVLAGKLRPCYGDHPAFFLTPLKQTLPLIRKEDRVTYGDADPFLDAQDRQAIQALDCHKRCFCGANHSLCHAQEAITERYRQEVCAEMARFLDEIR